MKHILFSVLFFSAVYVSAQSAIGINGGFLYPTSTYDDQHPQPNHAFKVEAEVFFKLHKKLHLKTGIGFHAYAFNYEYQLNDEFGNHLEKVHNVYTASYLSVPIGLQYELLEKKVTPLVDLSFTTLFNVGNQVASSNSYSTESTLKTNAVVFMPSAGLGIKYRPVDHVYLSAMGNYNLQLMNVYDAIGGFKYNAIGVLLSVGYTF